jgi:hypothetical protein
MKFRLLALGAFLMCLTSCFDVIEKFNIKEDGSGTYELKMDMSRSLGLLAMMKQGANDGKQKEKVDTVIYTKDVTDTSSSLTNEEKAVLRKSYTKVHMDEDEGEGYVNMYYPFANASELEIIQKVMSKVSSSQGVKNAVAKSFGKEMPAAATGDGNAAQLPTGDFAYSLTANSLVRKVKPSVKDDIEPKESDEQLPPQLKEMMKINYSTTVNLPRPAKNVKSSTGKLSDDKKQFKFSKTLDIDAKVSPADFDFSIDY